MKYELSYQGKSKTDIDSGLTKLKSEINKRDYWSRLPMDKKKLLIKKDPAMAVLWEQYQYLKGIFEGIDSNG